MISPKDNKNTSFIHRTAEKEPTHNIGHFLIGEAIYEGLGHAVRKMRAAMDRGRA